MHQKIGQVLLVSCCACLTVVSLWTQRTSCTADGTWMFKSAFEQDCGNCMATEVPQTGFVVLISRVSSAEQADFNLTPRQCEILSQCLNRVRANITRITVGTRQNPLDSREVAHSAQCLPDNVWSCFSSQQWPNLSVLRMYHQKCSLACAQGFVQCSFPVLQYLYWDWGDISATVCAVLRQACLPKCSCWN